LTDGSVAVSGLPEQPPIGRGCLVGADDDRIGDIDGLAYPFDLRPGEPDGEIAGMFARTGGFVHVGGQGVEFEVQPAEEMTPVN